MLRSSRQWDQDCCNASFCIVSRYQNGQDEGRDAFKSLKNQQIADKSALLYLQWAELEAKSGKACYVLAVQFSCLDTFACMHA